MKATKKEIEEIERELNEQPKKRVRRAVNPIHENKR